MSKLLSNLYVFFFILVLIECHNPAFNQTNTRTLSKNTFEQNEKYKTEESSFTKTKYVPPEGKTLLIIGQDLKSCWDYVQSGSHPEPAGITTYMNLYDLTNGNTYYPYGGLGEDISKNVTADVDWGAGPLNAHNAAAGYPNSVLVIGLYMTEEFFTGGLNAIANGIYNEQIDRLGTFIESVEKPVYVRIGYEFDGTWNAGYEKHDDFKNAYRNIVTRIRNKTDNFVSVWQSCTSPIDDILEGKTENIADWYPGDDYVDWCALSWFLPENESRNNSPTQKQLADEMLNFARNHNKPIMIAESAPQGYDLLQLTKSNISHVWDGTSNENTQYKTADKIWDEWFAPFFNYIYQNSDVIKAVAYINCDWDSQAKWAPPYSEGYWGDTRIESNTVIKNKWIEEINKPNWLNGSSDLFSILESNIIISSSSSSESSNNSSNISSNSSSDTNPTENIDVKYNITNDWGSGFIADVIITNNSGTAINGWEVTWIFPGNQNIINLWNGTLTQSGQMVKVSNADFNKEIPINGSVSFGFQGSYSGTNDLANDITINGNSISSSDSSISSSSSITSSSSSSVFKKVIPGKIEAEDYDRMSGVQTEEASEGTLNVGWIDVGDWLEYDIHIDNTSVYNFEFRVANMYSTGKIDIILDGQYLKKIFIPETGGWQNWISISENLTLPDGDHTIRLYASGSPWNLNWFGASLNSSSSSSSLTSSSSSSFDEGPKNPGINETLIMIGQTYLDEYESYISGAGTAPAGSSHYGELYTGTINQGSDENNHFFLNWIGNNYPKAYVTLAMSIKDNTRAGGYGSLDPNAADYSANACYKALIDVTNGVWNQEIDNYAQTLKSYPEINFLLRIGYEVSMGLFANSSERDWLDILIQYSSQGINILENPHFAPEIDLDAYKNAFNYIADRIRNVNNVSNVQFVFHPVRGYSDTTALYPGDQFVDYIGFSVFNHDVCINTLEADGSIAENGNGIIDSNLQKSIEWAKTKKSVMIAESGFQTPSGGQTSENFIIYLDRLFNLIETYDIRALTYINSDWTSHYWSLPWGDSRIESNQTVKNYWLSRTGTSRYINY